MGEEVPKGTRVPVAITREAAQQLAYYKSWPEFAVLAPRGWHCFGINGSDGHSLFVTPEPIDASRARSIPGGGLAGNAVAIEYSLGGTSGRFRVAEVIARVFPEYRAFVNSVREMFDFAPDRFPLGPQQTSSSTETRKWSSSERRPKQMAWGQTHG
jgi:hypothetical protein